LNVCYQNPLIGPNIFLSKWDILTRMDTSNLTRVFTHNTTSSTGRRLYSDCGSCPIELDTLDKDFIEATGGNVVNAKHTWCNLYNQYDDGATAPQQSRPTRRRLQTVGDNDDAFDDFVEKLLTDLKNDDAECSTLAQTYNHGECCENPDGFIDGTNLKTFLSGESFGNN